MTDSGLTEAQIKQCSELSPLLLGLLIEQLHELIAMRLEQDLSSVVTCVSQLGHACMLMMHMIHMKLLALNDPKALQPLLDVLRMFCRLFDVEIN